MIPKKAGRNRNYLTSRGRLVEYVLNKIWVFLLIVPFYLNPNCLALDEEGCLICHHYPGLVRLEKSGRSMVLHIDEQKYLRSAHGKVCCKQCHTVIAKVPHTNASKVTCTTSECHKGVARETLVKKTPLQDYHKAEQSFVTSLEVESSCKICHQIYPHSENNMVRAFLNMHTGFLHCEVCHVKKDKYDGLTYVWGASETAEFSGEPFGTYYNPNDQKAVRSTDKISRISVAVKEDGVQKELLNTIDIAEAKAFQAIEKELSPQERKEKLKFFHRDIDRKEISVACNQCHSESTILDYQALGFCEKKNQDLIYLNIKGLVTKYKEFYFPDLFKH